MTKTERDELLNSLSEHAERAFYGHQMVITAAHKLGLPTFTYLSALGALAANEVTWSTVQEMNS